MIVLRAARSILLLAIGMHIAFAAGAVQPIFIVLVVFFAINVFTIGTELVLVVFDSTCIALFLGEKAI